MGDHRASIKIDFEMHGVKKKTDMYINWYDPNNDGIDERVLDFFREASEEAMLVYSDLVHKEFLKRKQIETEKYEKKEYERLKNKFESPKVNHEPQ